MRSPTFSSYPDWDPAQYLTIQAAIDSLGGGSPADVSGWNFDGSNNAAVIEVRDSTVYLESVLLDTNKVINTDATHKVTIRAQSGQTPIVDADDADNGIVVTGVPYVTVTGFTLAHSATLVLAANTVLLGGYTLGCHSLRHLIGGVAKLLSASPVRSKAYDCVSCLNRRHMLFAWLSLFMVGFSDLYVRLCSMGVWSDLRLL